MQSYYWVLNKDWGKITNFYIQKNELVLQDEIL